MQARGVPVLNDWKLASNGRVTGTVKNHPSIPNGDVITTSPLETPAAASVNKVVVTISGSNYRLGTPMMVDEVNGESKESYKEKQKRARKEYDLTGEVVGDEKSQYLLCGKPQMSTSRKSQIYKGYRADSVGLPCGPPVTVKISTNWEALEREAANYRQVNRQPGKQFVKLIKFYPTASEVTTKFKQQSALVMERGAVDLKKFVQMNGKLQGKDMRDAAAVGAQCLQSMHQAGLVWTDLKTENFVVMENGNIKGIDLESAMPHRENPVDYSPEATPPEFAQAFLAGDGPYFVLDYNYDMWSYGMYLYELATGKGYFEGKSPIQITKSLKEGPAIDLQSEHCADIEDSLKDLITSCVQLEPKSRPNMAQILLHPYFLSGGIGPFSFGRGTF